MKRNKYAPLLAIAQKQFESGKRCNNPKFVAAAATTFGEFSPSFVSLQEWITRKYAEKLKRMGPRDDGLTKQRLTAVFRNDLRSSIQVAIARGVAKMILGAGLDRSACRKSLAPNPTRNISGVSSIDTGCRRKFKLSSTRSRFRSKSKFVPLAGPHIGALNASCAVGDTTLDSLDVKSEARTDFVAVNSGLAVGVSCSGGSGGSTSGSGSGAVNGTCGSIGSSGSSISSNISSSTTTSGTVMYTKGRL
jgi:hypothetical protein